MASPFNKVNFFPKGLYGENLLINSAIILGSTSIAVTYLAA